MPRIYYHNITKGIINESDLEELLEQSDKSDKIFFSEEGRGLIFPINEVHEDEEKGEYDDVRKDFEIKINRYYE